MKASSRIPKRRNRSSWRFRFLRLPAEGRAFQRDKPIAHPQPHAPVTAVLVGPTAQQLETEHLAIEPFAGGKIDALDGQMMEGAWHVLGG